MVVGRGRIRSFARAEDSTSNVSLLRFRSRFAWRIARARQPAAQFQSFRLAHRRIVPFDDCDLSKYRSSSLAAIKFPCADPSPERERLQNKMIAVSIDDHAWQSVAFAPNDASSFGFDLRGGRDIPPLALIRRLKKSRSRSCRRREKRRATICDFEL